MKLISCVHFDGGKEFNRQALRLIGRDPDKDSLGGRGSQTLMLDASSKEYRELLACLVGSGVEFHEHFREQYSPVEVSDRDFFSALMGDYWKHPEPLNGFEYDVYDNNSACPECGNGAVQIGSYRINSTNLPKQKKWVILGVDYAHLVTDQVVAALIEQKLSGWKSWPLFDHRSGKPVAGWSQLKAESILPPISGKANFPVVKSFAGGLFGNGLCACGRIGRKAPEVFVYDNHLRESFKDFNLTSEWLGGGLRTFRQTVISGRLLKLALQMGVKPIILRKVIFD